MEVELGRDHQGYGFSIRGGRELNLPIFVLRMAEGGAAERDGRLRVSDESVFVCEEIICLVQRYTLLAMSPPYLSG